MNKEHFKSAIKTNPLVVWLRLVFDNFLDSFLLTYYNGSANQTKNVYKKQAELQIRSHALEKGMSIGKARSGFGKPKALSLIEDLDELLRRGGDRRFVVETVSVLRKYISYNEELGADMKHVADAVDKLCLLHNIEAADVGGIYTLSLKDIEQDWKASFVRFSQSRYSVRDFGGEPLDMEKVKAALKLCERTPSACNRQSWRIHVYTDKELRSKMFRLQGGCRGFDEDMQCAVLICGDLRNYGFYEQNLPYVDGGIYAMNLLYTLHSQGLAAIPLTMGHKARVTNKIKKEMRIPSNEVPVLLIGVGTFKEEFKVAVSHRCSYEEYVKFDC